MSAFIVSDNTINRIVSHLNMRQRDYNHIFDNNGYPLGVTEYLQQLASDLHLMNCDAVDARYGHGTAAQDEADVKTDFKFQFTQPESPLRIYKALQCYLYQCSEGDIDQRRLYKMMQRLKTEMADNIIRQLPGYEDAPWS